MLTPRKDDPNYASEKIRRAAQPHTFGPGMAPDMQVSEDLKTEGIVNNAVKEAKADALAKVESAKSALEKSEADLKAANNRGGVGKAIITKIKDAIDAAETTLLEAEDELEKLTG